MYTLYTIRCPHPTLRRAQQKLPRFSVYLFIDSLSASEVGVHIQILFFTLKT